MDNKICSKCGLEKPLSEYYYNTHNKRHEARCKKCVKESNKNFRLDNLEKFKQKDKIYYDKNKEKLNEKCRERWSQNKDKYSLSSKKWQQENKEHVSQKNKEYRILNKEKLKEKDKIKGKEYYEKNKEKCNARNKRNYEKNKEKYLARNKLNREKKIEHYRMLNTKWTLNKRNTDESFKIKCILRDRIRFLIKTGKMKKTNSTIDLIGCSVDELKQHLESQFKDGMRWDNHGKFGWHVDHIKPCISFDLTNPEEQKRCFHFSNLQPLWWKENLRKGSKIA